jgi:hypothetical protein
VRLAVDILQLQDRRGFRGPLAEAVRKRRQVGRGRGEGQCEAERGKTSLKFSRVKIEFSLPHKRFAWMLNSSF